MYSSLSRIASPVWLCGSSPCSDFFFKRGVLCRTILVKKQSTGEEGFAVFQIKNGGVVSVVQSKLARAFRAFVRRVKEPQVEIREICSLFAHFNPEKGAGGPACRPSNLPLPPASQRARLNISHGVPTANLHSILQGLQWWIFLARTS